MNPQQLALRKNLLSSLIALAFPTTFADKKANSTRHQNEFLLQLPQIRVLLEQNAVFASLFSELPNGPSTTKGSSSSSSTTTGNKALDKFHAKVWEMMDQKESPAIQNAGLELLLVEMHQIEAERIEKYLLTAIWERLLRLVKSQQQQQQQQQSGLETDLLGNCCRVLQVICCQLEFYAPETRKVVFENLSKLLPAIFQTLNGFLQPLKKSKDAQSTAPETLVAASFGNDLHKQFGWQQAMELFASLLQHSPSTLRSYNSKLENTCSALFHGEFTPEINGKCVDATITCLSLLCRAGENPVQSWKQMMARAVEMLHLLLDLLIGRRPSNSNTSNEKNPVTTALRNWTKESSLEPFPVYAKAEMIRFRIESLAQLLERLMANSNIICEREIQSCLPELLAVCKRAMTMRVFEIGKQSAVSSDGFRLASCVLYGFVPQIQSIFVTILGASVRHAKLCALRHCSRAYLILLMAFESGLHWQNQVVLYRTLQGFVQVFGASSIQRLCVKHGILQIVLDNMRQYLSKLNPSTDVFGAASNATGAASSATGNKKTKGKKRKREAAISNLAALRKNAGGLTGNGNNHELDNETASWLKTPSGQLMLDNFQAGLDTLTTMLMVYASVLPQQTRQEIDHVVHDALVFVKKLANRKDCLAPTADLNAMTRILLADAICPDATGSRGNCLQAGLEFWRQQGSNSGNSRSLDNLLAMAVGESVLHPRAAPLVLKLQDAAPPETKDPNGLLLKSQQRTTTATAAVFGGGAVVGSLDWEKEDEAEEETEENEEDGNKEEHQEENESVGSPADEDEDVANQQPEEEEVQEDEEENYDDVKPQAMTEENNVVEKEPSSKRARVESQEELHEQAQKTVSTKTSPKASPEKKKSPAPKHQPKEDDDDDDEFPDIVDDEPDD